MCVCACDSVDVSLQVFFSWFPKKHPFHGQCRRWNDVIHDNMQQLKMLVTPVSWFGLAQDWAEWYAMYKDTAIRACCPKPRSTLFACVECHCVCHFRARLKHHKCATERRKPLSEQTGTIHCFWCDRWLANAGGLTVHHCEVRGFQCLCFYSSKACISSSGTVASASRHQAFDGTTATVRVA